MLSDEHGTRAFAALADARAAFQSAVVAAVAEVEGYLAAHRAPIDGKGRRVEAELGVFAAGRIDPERFAALLDNGAPIEQRAATLIERSLVVLRETAGAGERLFRIDVAPGADLAATVDTGLALAGRAFGAARVAELARTGRAAAGQEDPTGPWPFARWNRSEKTLAPPLVVHVDGGDLVVGGLAAFLDGRQKIALVVREPAPPAPLVRLITPGVFVMQTADTAEFARFAAFDGPAIAALVPESCARFVHDPGASPARLSVTHLPAEAPKGAVGRIGTFVQAEELKQLELLASGTGAEAAVAAATAAGTAPGARDGATAAADLLAAWLLRQADLSDAG